MEINYTFYFFAFLRKMIKKLLTFCYWQNSQKHPNFRSSAAVCLYPAGDPEYHRKRRYGIEQDG